jgi:hypothetical protein
MVAGFVELRKEYPQTKIVDLILISGKIEKCKNAQNTHRYLIDKKIDASGLYQIEDRLFIPIYNIKNEMTSYQTISPNGKKMFMKDSIVKSSFFTIKGDSNLCICEGLATGKTIHKATGYTVIMAFNASNIYDVALHFKNKNLLICADNDWKNKINSGLNAAFKIKDKLNCKIVYPENIQGSDFNDMYIETNISEVRRKIFEANKKEIISFEKQTLENDSLEITNNMIPDGLISEGYNVLNCGIPQYTLPLVLTIIARAISGKIFYDMIHPNLFNIKIGGTSTGKTLSDKQFRFQNNIPNFITINELSSGAALWRTVSEHPHGMGLFDEVKSLFDRSAFDKFSQSKVNSLIEIYTSSGMSFTKRFGDSKNNVFIKNPCFNLIGNTTPEIFDSIQLKDFETGLMQRFDFWMYDGKIKFKKKKENINIQGFIKKIQDIMNQQYNHETIKDLINESVELEINEDAENKLEEFSDQIIIDANDADENGLKGFITRKYDLSIKYALIHHASTNNLFNSLTIKDINYGILMASKLCDWKINILITKVTSGDFHRDCNIFKDAIIKSLKLSTTKNPTFKTLCNRKPNINNWDDDYLNRIKKILLKKHEIVVEYNRKGDEVYSIPHQ